MAPRLTRHQTLYFPDGDIVICSAGIRARRIAFRVHISALTTHSRGFRTLLTTYAGIRMFDETYDGVPLVKTKDAAEGWEDILGIIYGTNPLQYQRGDPENPERLRPAMSVAVKYDFDSIMDAIRLNMRSEWPASLADFDNLEHELTIHPTHAEGNHNPLTYFNEIPEPATAIAFAREFMPDILAVAFYVLSCIDLQHDWDACTEEQRALQFRTAKWRTLTVEDHMQLTRGKIRILPCWKAIIGEWPDAYYVRLAGSCTCSLADTKQVWDSAYSRVCASKDIMLELKRLVYEGGSGFDDGACQICHDLMTQKFLESRTKLWGIILQLFIY